MGEYTHNRPLRLFEICAGYGSQALALERLKRDYPDFDFELAGWCECDPESSKPIDEQPAVIAHNALHPEGMGKNWGDLTKIDWEQVPDFDLLTASTPCQSISSAGLQHGFTKDSGTRSSIIWNVHDCVRIKRPKYILMENVSAILSDKFFPLLHLWMVELEYMGYTNFMPTPFTLPDGSCTRNGCLNSKHYGVPQNRERWFMVSILDCEQAYYFPKPFPLEKRLKDVLETNVPEHYYLSDERVQKLLQETMTHKERGNGFAFKPHSADDIASTVKCSGIGDKTDNYIAEPSEHSDKHYNTCATRTRSYKGQPETLEIGSEDAANTITSVAKDSMVVESHRQANIRAKIMPNGDIRCYDASTPDKRGISELQFTNPDNEAPTVTTQGQIKVIEHSIITPPHGYFEGAVNTETSPTIKSSAMQAQNFVVEQSVLGWVRDEKGNVVSRPEVEVAICVTAGKRENTQNYVKEQVILTTQRTEKAKELRRQGIETFANREYTERKDGCCGTITTVAKDNYVKEEISVKQVWNIVDTGNFDNPQRGRIYDPSGCAPCLNCEGGGGLRPKIIEYFYANREPRVYENECPTIRSERTGLMCTNGLRIRRLSERELFRLMDVDEGDIDTLLHAGIAKTQLAKLAGNSIVVACLYYIFKNMFIETTPPPNTQTQLF